MKNLRLLHIASLLAVICMAAAATAAQTFTTLLTFQRGVLLPGDLAQGRNGSLYSISGLGGAHGWGSVLEISNRGVSAIYNFCSLTNCTDGAYPQVGVLLGADGDFYGTTFSGGNSGPNYSGAGTVFKVTPAGDLTTLYDFCSLPNCTDGSNPEATVMQAANGNLFGTTFTGGTNPGPYNTGYGTLFEITPGGNFTSLYSFCSQPNCTDGAYPKWPPVQSINGELYGTTYWGGTYNNGTVYSLNRSGKLTTLYSFSEPAAANPFILMQASDGNLYGTTNSGGPNGSGTIFKVTLSGELTTIYTFCSLPNCADGAGPTSLLQGPDGNLYGTTFSGGTGIPACGVLACGTIFQLTPSGTLTTLYNFCTQVGCPDGTGPVSSLLATNGTFYGTTQQGGSTGLGTLFSLSMGFHAFVEVNPGFGKVRHAVGILGNNLNGSSRVTFNGLSANFKAVSETFIQATVPSGATTGPIQVTTPSGVLNGSVIFYVLP